MASLRPRSPPTSRPRRAPAASGSGVLTPDVLFDVLLRLPAKDLCRLRAVCRSWRVLTSDRLFVTAHAARHRGPLFVAKFRDDKTSISIVDLSGIVVKRIAGGAAAGPYHQLLCTRLSLACLATDWNRCSVVNPATGAVHVLPQSPAAEHVNRVNLRDPYTIFTLGRVPSTGEHKVLRMFNRLGFQNGGEQLFEVFTINGAGTDRAQWRGSHRPGLFIDECSGTVVDGVIYFLTHRVYECARHGIRPDYIVSFDLRREEWRGDLRGPISSNVGYEMVQLYKRYHLTLADLKGSLVLADQRDQPFSMDLWFLADFGTGLWVKEYHIRTESIVSTLTYKFDLKPLLVLDDGRLVLNLASKGLLFLCDPGTNTFAEMDIRCLDSVGVYTGNLLSLGEGDMV